MGRFSFRQLTEALATRIEIIVHFLAILELCKLGHVELGQGADLRRRADRVDRHRRETRYRRSGQL